LQLSQRRYGKFLSKAIRKGTVNKQSSSDLCSFYRDRFGPYCGWCHCYLFAAELSSFRDRVNGDVSVNRATPTTTSTATTKMELEDDETQGSLDCEPDQSDRAKRTRKTEMHIPNASKRRRVE